MFHQLTLPSIARPQKPAMLESHSVKKVQLHQILVFCKMVPLSLWKWENKKKDEESVLETLKWPVHIFSEWVFLGPSIKKYLLDFLLLDYFKI